MPLDVGGLVIQGPAADLKQAHGHAGSDLGEFDGGATRADEDVVAELDAVGHVLERDDAGADLVAARGRLARGEEVFEDLDDAGAERGGEVVEQEVRVGFGDGAASRGGEVVPEEDVVQREGGGGAVREVGHGERSRGPAVFVQEEEVRQVGGVGAADESGEHERAAVQPDRRWEEQADFFGKGRQPRRRGAGCGDERAWVNDAGKVAVFVVERERLGCHRRGFIVRVGG